MTSKEQKKEYDRLRHLANPKLARNRVKAWKLKNKGNLISWSVRYPVKAKEYYRKRYLAKGDEIRARSKVRSVTKRLEINAGFVLRRKTDICFAIKCRLQTRINNFMRRYSVKNRMRTVEFVGCSIEFLRGHLEAKFKTGMTWENRNLWEIDHVVPCAAFDLSQVDQQKKCFHYSNLQPLWRLDNRIKRDLMPDGTLGRDGRN